jgi:hypothetical protein
MLTMIQTITQQRTFHMCADVQEKKRYMLYSRARFSVSSSSFLVFKEVLLEAALFVPAVAAGQIKIQSF